MRDTGTVRCCHHADRVKAGDWLYEVKSEDNCTVAAPSDNLPLKTDSSGSGSRTGSFLMDRNSTCTLHLLNVTRIDRVQSLIKKRNKTFFSKITCRFVAMEVPSIGIVFVHGGFYKWRVHSND